MNRYTWVINSYKNLPYLKLALVSIRRNAYYKNQPIIVYTENDPETAAWCDTQADIECIHETNEVQKGIGGGVNEAIKRVKTEFFSLIHSDMYISEHYDAPLLDLIITNYDPTVACAWRVEPNIWNQSDRVGTTMAPANTTEGFGLYHHDFQPENFEAWADMFVKEPPLRYRKVEGVSYMMRTKDFIPNSPVWAPTSMEDHDQSVRMQCEGYNFIVTSEAVVWHFGARSSHFLGQPDKLIGTSERQKVTEARNYQRWLKIWQEPLSYDEVGFIKVSDNMRSIYMKNRDKYLIGDYSHIINAS